MFRVAQEAVRNVAAHAGACRVGVRLVTASGCAVLTISDDGLGFDPATLADQPGTGHFGLVMLRDLAADAGGELRVDSVSGGGTRLKLEVPLR